jgi:CRP-like cAMP-binding protein
MTPESPQLAAGSKFWCFKDLFLFEQLESDTLQRLDIHADYVQFAKGNYVYLPGEEQTTVYYLKEGYIKLGFRSEDGQEMISDVLQPGEIFGSIGLNEAPNPNEFAQAVSDVSLCSLDRERFETLLQERPELSVQVLKKVGEQLTKVNRKLASLAFKDARTRIVEFLQDFGREYGRVRGGEVQVDFFLTHQEIANLTATSRQLVSATLSELKQQGSIDYSRRHLALRGEMSPLL